MNNGTKTHRGYDQLPDGEIFFLYSTVSLLLTAFNLTQQNYTDDQSEKTDDFH